MPSRLEAAWLIEHPMCAGWPNGTCSGVAARYDAQNRQSLCADCYRKKALEEVAAKPQADPDQAGLW